jgi:hypothetical protein
MQRKWKQSKSVSFNEEGGQAQERVLCWSFQALTLLLESVDMGLVNVGKLEYIINFRRVGYVSSTSPICQQGQSLALDS